MISSTFLNVCGAFAESKFAVIFSHRSCHGHISRLMCVNSDIGFFVRVAWLNLGDGLDLSGIWFCTFFSSKLLTVQCIDVVLFFQSHLPPKCLMHYYSEKTSVQVANLVKRN